MQFRKVETVTNNEDYVRLRIFDGEIPLDAAGAELLRLYREQLERAHSELASLRKQLSGRVA